jgi:glycosyltransferase involved in cell wall biosynthesis
MKTKLKILHCVEAYYPSVGGMQEVVKQLSERLVKLGHDVTVAARKHEERNFKELNGVKIEEFDVSGNMVNGIKGDAESYQRFLLNGDFDIVTFFAAQQWATDLALPILDKIKGRKVSVPTGYSGFYQVEFKSYFENMRSWIRQYDMNVYLSDDYRDINFARENGVDKIKIIPNGAAEDEFLRQSSIDIRKELGLSKSAKLILHVGSFTGRKGQYEAIRMFLKADLKNTVLLLIGNSYELFLKNFKKNYRLFIPRIASALKGNKIIIGQYSREFTVEAYKQSDLFLFPSNIECSPIVLFECAAAKLPFLCTDVGNSPEIAKWTGGGKIIKTIKDSEGYSHADIEKGAKALTELMNDEVARRKLADTAFMNWKAKYSWEKITLEYEKLYLELNGK